MKTVVRIAVSSLLALAAGCGAYRWRTDVPADMRTVSVPVFRNEGNLTGLGGEVARQVLRELEREGTFRIAAGGEAAVEVQGSVSSASPKVVAYERKTGARNREHALSATAKVSFVDRRAGRVLVEDRRYTARTTFLGRRRPHGRARRRGPACGGSGEADR